MIASRAAIDQLEHEARRLEIAADNAPSEAEAQRLRLEARARRERMARLTRQRSDGVRFA